MHEEVTPLAVPPDCVFEAAWLRNFVTRTPAQHALGTELVSVGPRSAHLRLDWREAIAWDALTGSVAGGAISTVADQACGLAMLLHLKGLRSSGGTIQLHMDFLRPSARGAVMDVEAECVTFHGRTACMRHRAYERDLPHEPIAMGTAIFMIEDTPAEIRLRESPAAEARVGGRGSHSPYVDFLGLKALEGEALTLPARPAHIGNVFRKSVHGGVLAGFLETAGLERLRHLGFPSARTLSFTTQYLRRALAKDTHAKVSIVRQGSRIATLRLLAWQDDPDKPVAYGNGQFLLEP